jgi:hypothetical protein
VLPEKVSIIIDRLILGIYLMRSPWNTLYRVIMMNIFDKGFYSKETNNVILLKEDSEALT